MEAPQKKEGKKLKVGTLYLKDAAFFLFHIFQRFGFEPMYLDNPSTKKLEDLANVLSEEICFPLKMFIADLYQGIENGADVIVGISYGLFNVLGPCRLPYFMEHKMEKMLKQSSGKDFKFVIFHFAQPGTFLSFVSVLGQLGFNMKSPLNMVRLRRAYQEGLRRGFEVYQLENVFRSVRARALQKELAIATFHHGVKELEQAKSAKQWKETLQGVKDRLSKVPQDEALCPLRIGIVGDYASILGNFPHFDIENFLSKKFNIEVVQPHSLCNELGGFEKHDFTEKRKQYSKYWIGGSDMATVEALFRLKELKVDGIIHLKAFGCIPEDMVTLMIEQMKENEEGMPPIMALTFDQHSSPEGIKTRLEAFCNTLALQKV